MPDSHPLSDALYLQSLGGERRALRFRDGRLSDLGVWYPGQPLVGNCYRARVTRLEPSLGLAFCDLGSGPQGVLPLEQAPKSLTEGAALPVRLVRAAAPGKGPKLAPARGPADWQEGPTPRLLEAKTDLLARFLAPKPEAIFIDAPDWKGELGAAEGIRFSPGGFSLSLTNTLEAEVEALLGPQVAVGGGSLLIEPGETLTAIDVNLGAAGRGNVGRENVGRGNVGRGKAGQARAAFNHQVLDEVARQVRLRALAGRILIDCLSLDSSREREALKAAARQAFAGDSERVEVKGMTVTALLELTRRRGLFAPLHELLTAGDPLGGRRLKPRAEAAQVIRQLAARRRDEAARALVLEVSPSLLQVLEGLESWRAITAASGSLLTVLSIEESQPARHRIRPA
ncbi:MAG: ribonuclease E/G [Kiloniellales bacterium]